MNNTDKTIRFIIQDHEESITWNNSIPPENLQEVVIFSFNSLRKKFKSDSFVYRDGENQHHELEEIIKFEIPVTYLTAPNRPDITTLTNVNTTANLLMNQPKQRTSRHIYFFKEENSVKILKYEGDKKFEEVEMKIPTMKIMNDGNKGRSYEEPKFYVKEPEKESGGLMKKITGALNPFNYFGSKKEEPKSQGVDDKNSLSPNFYEDISKRQKVPLEDGKSQYKFIDLQKNQQPVQKDLKMYTLEDLAPHNTEEDAWIAINGKVYDVTKYIPYHPGGKKIMPGCGKDGTALFNKYHAWVNANYLLEKYHIGFLKR